MKITELSITVARTFNLGNYESLRLEAGAAGTPTTKDEDPEAMRQALLAEVKRSLSAAYKEHRNHSED